MEQSSSRWNEITPSSFDHEKAALAYVRDLLPDRTPYQAWSNFTFLSDQGHVREVDLLVATPTGLFLIEIKNFRGRLTNRGSTWMLSGGRTRSFDSPLPLADQKAKELKSLLGAAARKDRGARVPFLRGCVFLAEPGMECALEENQRHHLYVPDDARASGLLGRIGADLLLGPVRHAPPDQDFFRALPRLLEKVGIHRTRRSLTVGPWRIDPRPFDTGPTWVDHHATREDIPGQYRRVRIYLYERESDPEARESVRGAAQRELLATQGIEHPGLLTPRDILDHDMGPALLIEQHPDAQRLDHYLAADGAGLDLPARIDLVRQLAEAVGYAHERRLVHRALSPRAVIVEPVPDAGWDAPRLRVGEWQSAARGLSSSSTSHRVAPTTHAGRHVEASAAVYLAPEFTHDADGTVSIDLFGLGATAYLILTGKPPATDRAALAEVLKTAGGLHPATVDESLPGDLDDLVYESTRPLVKDRLADVSLFLEYLAELSGTEDAPPVADPFEARAGTELADGYVVERVLGTGATARAFLVDRDGHLSVLKVGRSAAAEDRLGDEAIALEGLHHDRVVPLKRGAFALGGGRHAIEIGYAGDQTLGALLKDEGVQLPDQLQRFGDQLLDAVGYLEGKKLFHRDIKPDNIGVSRHPKRGPDLTLFDFSLAGAGTRDVGAGTRGYRDPFLGTATRPTFDRAAELYAVAVTLHEMASLELPTWGEDGSDPQFVDAVTLASEVFDAGLRDGLVEFLTTALHRDAGRRFPTAAAMRQAWNRIFTTMDAERPATTSHSDSDDPQEQRDQAAAAATADTALSAAGLSLRAVAVAQRLGADTVGELIQIPNRMLWRARGLSRNTRLELVNRAGTWRKALPAPGTSVPPPDPQTPVEAPRALDTIASALLPAATTKGVDQREVARAVLGLPVDAGEPPPVRWPSMTDLAPAFGLTRARISQLTQKRRAEWAALPAVHELIVELAELLRDRGRVAAASELVASLLLARGCVDEDDPARRWAYGYATLRAAVEADSLADAPRFETRRHRDRMLVALQVGEDEPFETPNDAELLDMAAELADEAVRLADSDPLPTPVAVVRALEAVTRRFELVLAEQRMVQLAASAAGTVLANARLELYPSDLDPLRALRLSQAGAGIPPEGLTPEALGRRVAARFPGIAALPDGPHLVGQLRELGIELRWDGDRLVPPTIGTSSSSWHTSLSTGAGTAIPAATAEEGPEARIGHAVRRGGARVLTFRRSRWLATRDRVERLTGVEPVDVSAAFVAALREVARERRIVDFDVVLRADAPDADNRARTNLSRVTEEAWTQLESQWTEADVLVLDGLTPFGRYSGGMAVLDRLLDAARRGGGPGPRALVVLCAAQDENGPPRIGSHAVGLANGEEWVVAPSSWVSLTAA